MGTATSQPPPLTEQKVHWWRRGRVMIPLILVLLGLVVVAAVAFQPWKLFINQVVDEAPPTEAVAPRPADGKAKAAPVAPSGPTVVAEGQLISQEHETSGTAQIIELPDGSNVLRLEDLATSNGPDLEVWLADAPVRGGNDGWFVFDDGKYESLGPLKGNIGNQNYPIPDGVDIKDFNAVSIWCARFRVSFGAAELKPT